MPECATCEEYISPDFVRVFGDNNRVVTACPSCRGQAPEPAKSARATDPEIREPKLVTNGGGSETGDNGNETRPETYETPDYEEGTPGTTAETVEPEPMTATAGGSSALGFLRSVFSR